MRINTIPDLRRFDCPSGFLITLDGAPYQAMRREIWLCRYGALHVECEYWLASSDKHMPGRMALFVYATFAAELQTEFERTHPL